MNKYKIIVVTLICSTLGACVSHKTKLEPKSQVAAPNEITQAETLAQQKESILEYAGKILTSSADTQKKELADLNQTYVINKQFVDTRLKLALLYGLPNSKVRDTAKAQAFLDDLIREPSLDIERKTLASLVRDYIADTSKLAQKLREEQKRGDNLQVKSDTAQQKADSLQRKLDELKNIEKTMTDRDQGSK